MSDFEKLKIDQQKKDLTKKIKENTENQISNLNIESEKLEERFNELFKEKNLTSLDIMELKEISKTKNEIEEKINKTEYDAKKEIAEIEKADEPENEDKKGSSYLHFLNIRNPLQMIALFVSILELAALAVLPQFLNVTDPAKTLLSPANLTAYINFIIWFPVFVVSAFFITLLFSPESLYAPGDFPDQKDFLKLHIKDQVEKAVTERVRPVDEKVNRVDEKVNNMKLAGNLLQHQILKEKFQMSRERSNEGVIFEEEDDPVIKEVLDLLK